MVTSDDFRMHLVLCFRDDNNINSCWIIATSYANIWKGSSLSSGSDADECKFSTKLSQTSKRNKQIVCVANEACFTNSG